MIVRQHQIESERLAALQALHILDTEPEDVFDEAARMAATICGTSVAAVNFLDDDRQWFKARVGTSATQLAREQSFCEYAIGRTDPLLVPDATADERFRSNPHVTKEAGIRFYAGMPLNTPDGFTVGTLCVVDTVPRELTAAQNAALAALGRQVATQLELRAKNMILADTVERNETMARKLRQRNQLFSAFMEHSPTVGFIKDSEGRFLYYNKLFCERFAVSETEWLGKNVFDLFPEEFAAGYHAMDMRVLDRGHAEVTEESSPGPDGSTLYWRTHKFPINGENGELLLGALCLDISAEHEAALRLRASHDQLAEANEQLSELAVTDGLTGLRNRRAFDQRFDEAAAAGERMSLLLLDVDHFKHLNDTHGHAHGDDVLRTLARLLKKSSRRSDCVARIGGEEFAILLPGAGAATALAIAERLREAVAAHTWKEGKVTISVGLVTRSSSLRSPASLMEAADVALYRAKRSGRNRVEAHVGARKARNKDIQAVRGSKKKTLALAA